MKADSSKESGVARDFLLVALISGIALFATREDLRRLSCTAGDRPTRTFDYPFGTPVAGAPMVLVTEGCAETAQGIFVPPHGRCQINFWLRRDPGERARILLGVLRPEAVNNVLMFQGGENVAPQIIGRDFFLTDETDLAILPRGSLSWPELVLKATNEGDSPARLVHRARYSTFSDATNCLVDFRRLFAAWGAVIFSAIGLWQLRGSKRGRWLIVLVSLGMVLCSLFVASTMGLWTVVAALLLLLHQATASWKGLETRRSILTTAGLWAIGMLFVQLRYIHLSEAVNARLDPDAVMFRVYADTMSLFSPTGFFSGQFSEREPLYVFAAHLMFRLFGSSDLHLRYTSFLCSLPIPFLTYWIARCAGARRIASLISALVVSIAIPYLHELPSRGLRDDLFMTISAAFVLITILSLQWRSNWRWVAVAAAGAACMWTRSTTLVFAFALFTWLWLEGIFHRNHLDVFGWARRWRIWEGAACLTMIFLSFVPIRIAWKRIHGHADFPERGYARWNANVEFQDRLGTLGFATKQEFQITPYNGPPLTMREYLLRLHTPTELALGTLRGCVKAIRDLLPDLKAGAWINGAVAAAFIVLLISSLFLGPARVLTMAALSSLAYAGFFYDRGLIELRSAAHALPLFSAAALLSADLGVQTIRRYARSTNARTFRASLHKLRPLAAPALSPVRAIVVASSLALAGAAAVAARFPRMPPSPNAICMVLLGFYWKVATVFSWPVTVNVPLLFVFVAIALAIMCGIRWWAAVPVALFGGLIGFLSTPPEVFSGPTPRTYLWQHGETVERSIELNPSMRGRPARLRYYVREPFRTIPSQFSYRIEVNDQPVGTSLSTGQCPDCIAFQWREVPLPVAMLARDRITVRLRAMSDGDQNMNYVDIGRLPIWRLGTSRWDGNEHDLSPDPGENGGTLLIGLSFPATASRRGVPLWLGR